MFDEAAGRPAHGARLIVKLESPATSGASFGLWLSTPEGEWQGNANVRESDGDVAFGAWTTGTPPEWVTVATRALLRSAWQRRRAGHPWPRRLARWRPAPGVAEPE